MSRSGIGYDVHPFSEGRRLVLGGVEIPSDRGLAGHSDADVLLHALMDALLGAAGLGDIGLHFPPSEAHWLDADSRDLLARVGALVRPRWRIVNIDATVLAEHPRIGPYRERMTASIAGVLGISVEQVNVKATTNERLGFVGRGEGIAALAIASLDQREASEGA